MVCSIKPTLKKVSKYENKFAKLQKKAAEFNFRNQLKTVKKKEFTMEDDEAGTHQGSTRGQQTSEIDSRRHLSRQHQTVR